MVFSFGSFSGGMGGCWGCSSGGGSKGPESWVGVVSSLVMFVVLVVIDCSCFSKTYHRTETKSTWLS